jgi:hypothetical protein
VGGKWQSPTDGDVTHSAINFGPFQKTVVAEHRSLLDHSLCEGISVLQPSRFYPCPSGRDNAKLWDDLMFGNPVWHRAYKIYGLYW